MNRRNFFTKLLTGAAAIVVAPKVLNPKEPPYDKEGVERWNKLYREKVYPWRKPIMIDVSQIPDGMTADDIINNFHRSSCLIHKSPMSDITGMRVSHWGTFCTEYEYQMMLQMQESMERAMFDDFIVKGEVISKYDAGGIRSNQVQG